MKKNFMYLMTMMVAMLSVGFVSCSSDDDEGGGGSSSNSLVGDWQAVGGNYGKGMIVSFYEDGTCLWGDDGPYSGWNIANGKLNMTRYDGRVEEYSYEFKDGQLHTAYDNEYLVLEKLDLSSLNIDSSYFVGRWEPTIQSYFLTFYKTGTCSIISQYSGGGTRTGTWQYDPETQILETSVQSYKWKVVPLTEDMWTTRGGRSWKRVE